METFSKIGGTEKLVDFSKYFKLKKDEIRLKNPKIKEKDVQIIGKRIHT